MNRNVFGLYLVCIWFQEFGIPGSQEFQGEGAAFGEGFFAIHPTAEDGRTLNHGRENTGLNSLF
jgi:hypothetical protein